jgi:hypothetical protein
MTYTEYHLIYFGLQAFSKEEKTKGALLIECLYL